MPETPASLTADEYAQALDPRRRRAMQRALCDAVKRREADRVSVALIGWQAATLVETACAVAERVVIVESDEALVDSIQKGLVALDLGEKVRLVTEAPEQIELDERVDVAVCGLPSTWLIETNRARVFDNVRANVLAERGTMIPSRIAHLFEVLAAPSAAAGMQLRMPRPDRIDQPVATLGESTHFVTHDLNGESDLPAAIDDTIIVKPLLSGRIGALRLTTLCELVDGVVEGGSGPGGGSLIVPLREDVEVEAGQPVRIHVRFEPGAGLSSARFSGHALPKSERAGWEHAEHPVTERFQKKVADMIDKVDRRGRGADLDRVVGYTIEPHGDVSRLTALFWTIDEDYRKPLRDLVDGFRSEASSKLGATPSDEVLYDIMYEVYRKKRDEA